MTPPLDPAKATIIINPVSGKGDNADKRIEEICHFASQLGWKGTPQLTTKDKGADSIAKEAIKHQAKHIVVCGGDGTILEAASVMVNSSVLLGIVPTGTGNIFAQNLDIPNNTEAALKIALLGKPGVVDVGQANGIYFTIMAGLGLDAYMARDTDRKLKDKLGILAYLKTIIVNLPRPANTYRISVDNKPAKTYLAKSVMVANLGRISGGLTVVPHTQADNGTLQVGILHPEGPSAWINLLLHSLRGRIHHSQHYDVLPGKHVEIDCLDRALPFECDGTDHPAIRHLEVDILPKALWVIQPE